MSAPVLRDGKILHKKRTHIDITVTRSGANALFPETCPSVFSVSKKFSKLIQAGLGYRLNKKKETF